MQIVAFAFVFAFAYFWYRICNISDHIEVVIVSLWFFKDIPRDLITEFLFTRLETKILVYDQEILFTEDIALFSPDFRNNLKREIERMLRSFTVVQVFCKENPRTWKEVFDIPDVESLLEHGERKFAVMKKKKQMRRSMCTNW